MPAYECVRIPVRRPAGPACRYGSNAKSIRWISRGKRPFAQITCVATRGMAKTKIGRSVPIPAPPPVQHRRKTGSSKPTPMPGPKKGLWTDGSTGGGFLHLPRLQRNPPDRADTDQKQPKSGEKQTDKQHWRHCHIELVSTLFPLPVRTDTKTTRMAPVDMRQTAQASAGRLSTVVCPSAVIRARRSLGCIRRRPVAHRHRIPVW